MIRFACPSCGMRASAPEECAGRGTKCRGCNNPIVVPHAASPAGGKSITSPPIPPARTNQQPAKLPVARDKTALGRVIAHTPTSVKPSPRSEAALAVANYPAGKPKKAAKAVAAAPAQVAETPRRSILSKRLMVAVWTVIVFGAGGAFGFGIYSYLEAQRQAQKNGEGDSYAQASPRPEARPAQPSRQKASPLREDKPQARTKPPTATKPPVEEEPTPTRVPDSLPDSPPCPKPPPSADTPPRPAPSPKKDAAWTEYTSKEGGFTVRLPAGEVMHQDKPVNTPVGKLTIHIHGILPGNEEFFIILFYDYPKSAMGAGADILLDGAKTGLKAFTKGAKITKETKIKIGDHPGREWTIIDTTGKGTMKSRVYLVNNRLIQLVVGSGIGKVADKNVQKCFESFKLTGK